MYRRYLDHYSGFPSALIGGIMERRDIDDGQQVQPMSVARLIHSSRA